MHLENLVAQFEARILPSEDWTHASHLGIALWTLHRLDLQPAITQLREQITAYNEAMGLHNGPFSGYHETITVFYARAVHQFLSENPHRNDLENLWAELIEKWGDKNAIFTFYSRRYLFTPSARGHFLPPDRGPLPFDQCGEMNGK